MNSLFIGMVNSSFTSDKRSWCETLILKHNEAKSTVNFKIDTGAQANPITKSIVADLGAPVNTSSVNLRGYNNSPITNFGYVELPVVHKGNQHTRRFEIVDDDLCPILGLESSGVLGIVRRFNEISTADLLDEYPEVFEGIGCLQEEHQISLNPSVKPVIHPQRRIPLSITDKLKQELDKMENLGVIEKVDEPTSSGQQARMRREERWQHTRVLGPQGPQ